VPTLNEIQSLQAPVPPKRSEADLASFAALQKYYVRVLGFTYPEAELCQRRTSTSDGRVGNERDFPGYKTILQGMKKFTNIPVPSLVIFANPHSLGKCKNFYGGGSIHEEIRGAYRETSRRV
jgi:hypothetical protein